MKNAVVTIAIGEKYSKIAEVTHLTLKSYADKIGAEFIVLSEEGKYPHWEKFKLYDLLIKYYRIIYVDTDLLIREDCPNLFDLIPETKLGIFNEGRFVDREGSIKEACKEYQKELPKWDGTYYNTGVMVISRIHRPIFKRPSRIASLGMFEQGYLNMVMLSTLEIERDVEELDYKFNRMTVLDEHCGIHRLDSYIVHYAGAPDRMDLVGMMKQDLEQWEQKKLGVPPYQFERNVIIYAGGGLGDQLATEPVARFAMEHCFKDVKTNFSIITNWPRLFEHLSVPCMERLEWEAIPKYDTPFKVLKTIPAPGENPIWQTWSHVCAHTVDYAAVCALHKTLPDEYRTIKLQPTLEGLVESMDVAGGFLEDIILVHPGRGWDSKTFPASWWESLITKLLSEGKRVGVIGKHINKDQGYVDITVPTGAIDFRDLLSLDGLISIIASASMVVSNDSAPIHIAGAFDKYIILIATCKHPDHVLPYRQGSKYWRAYAFAEKLTVDDWDLSPTRIYKESADVVKGNILDYLPKIECVVEKVLEYCPVVIKKDDPETKLDVIKKFIVQKGETTKGVLKWNRQSYEVEVQNAIRKYISKDTLSIDVGANVGFFTTYMAEFAMDGKVFAFEPEDYNFKQLESNTKIFSNVIAFKNAVGNEEKDVKLFFNLDNDGGHALWDPALHEFNTMTRNIERLLTDVKMVTLDNVLESYPEEKVTLIKTDTEGCELLVLQGAKNILEKYHPVVISEIHYQALELMGTTVTKLQDYMRSFGYKTYDLPNEEEIDLSIINNPGVVFNVLFKV